MGKSINIKDFHKFHIRIKNLDKVVIKNAEKATDILHSISPVEERNSRRKGKYARGWVYQYQERNNNPYARVKNATDWQLTWLLERGHLIVNKKGGVGWASPHEHIRKAYLMTRKTFIEDCKNIDIDVDIL